MTSTVTCRSYFIFLASPEMLLFSLGGFWCFLLSSPSSMLVLLLLISTVNIHPLIPPKPTPTLAILFYHQSPCVYLIALLSTIVPTDIASQALPPIHLTPPLVLFWPSHTPYFDSRFVSFSWSWLAPSCIYYLFQSTSTWVIIKFSHSLSSLYTSHHVSSFSSPFFFVLLHAIPLIPFIHPTPDSCLSYLRSHPLTKASSYRHNCNHFD